MSHHFHVDPHFNSSRMEPRAIEQYSQTERVKNSCDGYFISSGARWGGSDTVVSNPCRSSRGVEKKSFSENACENFNEDQQQFT